MRKSVRKAARISVLAGLFLFLFGCEPISVSINAKGDIAFTRAEGIFVYDAKAGKLTTINWNYGTPVIPVIVRWAPDNDTLAYSAKPTKDGQDVEVYLVKKSGGTAKKVYASDKVLTQMEWSPDGKYLSLAQQGKDTDLSVADLVIISVADSMSKVLVANCGDVHNWLDEKTIAFVKISGKNGESSDVLNGKVSTIRVDGGDIQSFVDVRVTKTGGLDTSTGGKLIAFTALQAGPGSQDLLPIQIEKTDYDGVILPKLYDDDAKAQFASGYSLAKGVYKLKDKLDADKKTKLHELLSSAGYINTDKPYAYVVKAGDSKADKLSATSCNFLQFSPDGSSLLVKAKTENAFELGMISLADKSYKALAADIADTVSANSGTVQVYPSWSGNAAVVYFKENKVYGSNGMALTLMSLDTATLKKRNLQIGIDTEVAKLVESKGGY